MYKTEKGICFDGNVAIGSVVRLIDYPTTNPHNYAVQNIGDDRIWELNKNDYITAKSFEIAELKRKIEYLEKNG
jgi:hypothetical protein